MKQSPVFNQFKFKSFQGFTTIELVVTILIVAILAATIVPRLLTSSGFEEHTYRSEVITKLRAIQLRAMQNTGGSQCKIVKLAAKEISLYASKSNTTSNECLSVAQGENTSVYIDSSHQVNFSFSEALSSVSFSPLGKPLGCIVADPCQLVITITGEESLTVTINQEGYIYAS